MTVEIYTGDCLDVMALCLPDNSVDAIVTDPPYGLSFMGKAWDYDVPSVAIWAECLRVLKPGGHLLAFAGTRTQHRMAVNIEDAGFEIRDMLAWVYGSGFPKSLDVSKAIDKVNGEVGRLHKFTAWMRTTGLTGKQIDDATGTFMGSHYLTAGSQPAIPTPEQWVKLRPLCGDVPAWVDELVDRIAAEREVIAKQRSTVLAVAPGQDNDRSTTTLDITAPATDAARQWQGWGTALKPALEPITLARKPLVGTVAENVLTRGTGALNIDGCRVETADNLNGGVYSNGSKDLSKATSYATGVNAGEFVQPTGRWPANLIHDGSGEVLAAFPQAPGQIADASSSSSSRKTQNAYGEMKCGNAASAQTARNDAGSAARFFYCAKASKKDRNEGCEGLGDSVLARSTQARAEAARGRVVEAAAGAFNVARIVKNNHPTVKPTELMRYLCRLVTPPGGLVLDPFMGSGSTGKAAVLEGFRFVGIEKNPAYVEIARARIAAAGGNS